jgi:formylglycine-generating enzyme required for sulfatase activity
MIDIPGGTFEMGCSLGDSECNDSEIPRHPITISAFKMSTYEITQGQWEAVMGLNPSAFPGCGDDCPVESVSWNAVQVFIDELNSLTSKNYRLPTEAEWEYAARAGTTTKWYCGDDGSCLDDIAWYQDNSGDQTHLVGQKDPNAWGLYDMSGNVWEWCSDWYDEDYYSSSPDTDPQGPDSGSKRVIRGGSWMGPAMWCRSSVRGSLPPLDSYTYTGFRLCQP